MKIYLTGATGYIGSAVADALLAAKHTVIGMARSDEAEDKLRKRGVTPHRADLKHPETLSDAIGSCDGIISIGTTNDGRLDSAAVTHMLDLLKDTGKPIVYTSGVWVLGDTGGKVVDETAPLNPAALVAWRPDMEQLVLNSAAGNIRTVVIRPGIVYGRGGGIAADFVQSARQSGAARFVGTRENRWPVIHVDDLADLFVKALERAPAGSLYHAADASIYRVMEIAEAASFGAGAGGRAESWPLDDARKTLGAYADALVLDQQISSEKARRELGWTPRRPSIVDDLRRGSYVLQKASS
jgi:nucleoside-diphosphate-sugar epimerase